jgi:hypothetical protein
MAETIMVQIEGKTWPGTPLDSFEIGMLERQVISPQGEIAFGNTTLQALFMDNQALIKAACSVAKKAQGDVAYKGLWAGDTELGVSLILPEHVLRTTGATETPQLDWTFTFTADGDYWIGFGTDNDEAIHIDKRLLVLVLGIQWTQAWSPITEKANFQVGQNTYPYQSVRQGWMGDNLQHVRFQRLRPMIWAPRDTVLSQTYQIAAGVQEMQLVGLSFPLGNLMSQQAVTTVQL